jgi:GT2 family glycosyltransferase
LTSLAVVLVHYHAAELAAQALAAVERDLAGAGGAAAVEWIVVDNGSDPGERERLAALPARLLDPGRNLGFAGGVNLGVAGSSAEAILVMNPDVIVLPGCVGALLAELGAGAAVAGPSFYWDAGRRLRLPPSEARRRREELLAALALRGGGWARWARRRWRRHARRHWRATRPLPSYALAGALLAIARAAWQEVGPFDDGFPLYFEETDWLKRAERRGLVARYVPAAQAVHLYDQSAGREPRAAAWFGESALRFRRRHYGPRFAGFLDRLGRRGDRAAAAAAAGREGAAPGGDGAVEVLDPGGLDLAALGRPFPLWVEVSPRPVGFPAAAERIEAPPPGPWTLPAEVAARLPAGELTVAVTDERGRELLRRSLAVGRAGGGG